MEIPGNMAEKLSIKRGMKEAFAVTGYVPDEALRKLESDVAGKIDVRVERNSDEVVMRVDRADVAEIRAGASVNNETIVQVILRAGAAVETVVKAKASLEGVARFNDPVLQRLTATATAKSIQV
jgi:hypothetical protein